MALAINAYAAAQVDLFGTPVVTPPPPPTLASAPEMDPNSAARAVALLAAGLLVFSGRRRHGDQTF